MAAPTDCTPAAIYNALIASGFSTVQAIGAMANAIAESSLNPETSVIDSNGARSNGLWQFNEASYPTSGSLVTGNCRSDIANQIAFLKSHVSGGALSGSTGAEVAGNFAANFERCKGCTSGDTTTPNGWGKRVANAAIVEGWIKNGNWPTSGGSGVGGGGGGGAAGGAAAGAAAAATGGAAGPGPTLAANSSRCLIGGNTFVPCLIYASQARAIIGGLALALGGLLMLGGAVVIVAVAAQRSGVAGAIPGPAGVAVRAAASGRAPSRLRTRQPAPLADAARTYGRAQREGNRQPTARAA